MRRTTPCAHPGNPVVLRQSKNDAVGTVRTHVRRPRVEVTQGARGRLSMVSRNHSRSSWRRTMDYVGPAGNGLGPGAVAMPLRHRGVPVRGCCCRPIGPGADGRATVRRPPRRWLPGPCRVGARARRAWRAASVWRDRPARPRATTPHRPRAVRHSRAILEHGCRAPARPAQAQTGKRGPSAASGSSGGVVGGRQHRSVARNATL